MTGMSDKRSPDREYSSNSAELRKSEFQHKIEDYTLERKDDESQSEMKKKSLEGILVHEQSNNRNRTDDTIVNIVLCQSDGTPE